MIRSSFSPVDFKVEVYEIPPERLLIRAAAESHDMSQRTVERGKSNILPRDTPALDYGSQLNQIEATLDSILAAARSSVVGEGSIDDAARRHQASEGCDQAPSQLEPSVQPGRPDVFNGVTSRPGVGGLPFVRTDDKVSAGGVAKLDERRPREAGRYLRPQAPPAPNKSRTEIPKMSETVRDPDSARVHRHARAGPAQPHAGN